MIDFPDTGAARFDLLQKIHQQFSSYTDASLKRTLTSLTQPGGCELVRYSQNFGLYAFSDPLYHAYAMTIFHKTDSSPVDIDNLDLDFPTLIRLLEKELRKRGVHKVVEKT